MKPLLRPSRCASTASWVVGALGIVPLAGCGSGSDPVEGSEAPAAQDTGTLDPATSVARAPRDPRLPEVVRLLEAGLLDPAGALLDQVAAPDRPAPDVEVALLRARLELLSGDALGALRRVEEARALARDDALVLAAEIEVLVVLERLEGARERLREALKAHGPVAPLERVRGLCLLRTPGGGPEALRALEAARALDPELPFTSFPLHQAHLLTGRARLAEGAPHEALAQALLARRIEPANPESLELEAEARAELLDFDGALALYDRLAEVGRDTGATRALLHRRRATQLLLEDQRAEAVEAYATARRLGLDDEGLGFGAHLLAQESAAHLERGVAHLEAKRPTQAEAAFEEALALDPANAEARNHLGVCRFQRGDFPGAAEAWERVLEEARRGGWLLPDPVHLNLARAWRQAGDPARAREVLSLHLDRHPEGEWSEATRELLTRLEAESLSGDPP